MASRESRDPATRDRILRAAESVFADAGFRGATVGEIADRTGVNRALLYYYFENKHHIYRSLVQEGVDRFQLLFERVGAAEGGFEGKLGVLVQDYLEFCLADHGLARLVRRELAGGGDAAARLLAGPFREVVARVMALLAEGADAGCLRELDHEMAAYSLLGMMNVYHDLLTLGEHPPEPADAADHVISMFLDGVRADQRGTIPDAAD